MRPNLYFEKHYYLTELFRSALGVCLFLLGVAEANADPIRVATYNTSLGRHDAGDLFKDMKAGDPQVKAIAEIIQRVRPDILLLQDFDYSPEALAFFQSDVLSTPQDTTGVGAARPISFPYSFIAPTNSGVPSGYDLDGDGEIGGPGDAHSFGYFDGQEGMALLSKFPIASNETRTFQRFLWADMPKNLIPEDVYRRDAKANLRLSSKAFWDVVVKIGENSVHILSAHPSPPIFDGPEDRNGRRNFDEIRLIADYLSDEDYIYDDQKRFGGLKSGAHFVILGDMNADPMDGESVSGAIEQLLGHPSVHPLDGQIPSSKGAEVASARQGGSNTGQKGVQKYDTADFGFDPDNPGTDRVPGNLRVDYVLPSDTLGVTGSGVFWLEPSDPIFKLAEWPTSNHRMVWVDIHVP